MSDQPAILLCGHGTTAPDALAGFGRFVETLRAKLPGRRVEHAFLELVDPSFASALAALHRDGVRDVIALPVLLFTAGHIKRDIPAALAAARAPLPGLRLRLARPLGLSPAVVETACRVAAAALPPTQDRADTVLLLVGRGTSDPFANADAAKLARLVVERLGLAFSTTAYIAVTSPKPAAALALLEHLPFRHGLFMPVVLFDGMLYKQLAAELSAHRSGSTKQWRLAAPLAADSTWIDTFRERLRECEAGYHCREIDDSVAAASHGHQHSHGHMTGHACAHHGHGHGHTHG